jgi:hypothetical protein
MQTRGRWLALSGALLLTLAACSNPNGGGVQDFGDVAGRVLNAKTGQPVTSGLVSIGAAATQLNTANQGGFDLRNIPIGTQTITVNVTGYDIYTQQVQVVKDQQTQAGDGGYIRLNPLTP